MSETNSDINSDLAFYRKKLLLSMIIPGIIVFFMWLVKITEVLFGLDFSSAGIYPLTAEGLPGILLSPFIHADFKHLFSNTLPLFFLLVALFYFYSEVVIKISILTYVLTGLLVWIFGRSSWHIGASGLVYGVASFLFFSGIIRKYFRLIALSLLIVFLYGSMVWGIFPGIYKNVSWESHMLGFFSGVILSVWFRKEGPQRPVYEWEEEEDEEENGGMGEREIKETDEPAPGTQHPAT
ncbi:MAG: rhomboid family intramembrane serine protease [Bacteroidales bacterium]|nr:rhomboid family intramembrane serine protease [Bacteroidales bacterium]